MIKNDAIIEKLKNELIYVISETNGISLADTLELMLNSHRVQKAPMVLKSLLEFKKLLAGFEQDEVEISTLLQHPFSKALFAFFKSFPISYHEEHIHLTGSLNASFLFPYIQNLLQSDQASLYKQKIEEVYGPHSSNIETAEDIDKLIRLKEGDFFERYLQLLYLPKLILTTREIHAKAAYHMAKELYEQFNVGKIRLKFSLSRVSSMLGEQIPGAAEMSEEEVILGLYEGFQEFKKEVPTFSFVLSPSFRKEPNFYDQEKFSSKKDHFAAQVRSLLKLLNQKPFLREYLTEIDTVGDERELYRKAHFKELKEGLRKLQYYGLKIRSHHGETWNCLRRGIQSVDNAMNIWHIDALEHGISLGVNPNYYFHRVYQRCFELNQKKKPILLQSIDGKELMDMDWGEHGHIQEKLLNGEKLSPREDLLFLKTKFHHAREVEHYQHDVLNRMIDKNLTIVALPSSNLKLTGVFPDYKDHPFSWWEKKGVDLGVGTDNYITLNTNYIEELLILLYSDSKNLKITKLLMVATREQRRTYIGHLLWSMRKAITPEV